MHVSFPELPPSVYLDEDDYMRDPERMIRVSAVCRITNMCSCKNRNVFRLIFLDQLIINSHAQFAASPAGNCVMPNTGYALLPQVRKAAGNCYAQGKCLYYSKRMKGEFCGTCGKRGSCFPGESAAVRRLSAVWGGLGQLAAAALSAVAAGSVRAYMWSVCGGLLLVCDVVVGRRGELYDFILPSAASVCIIYGSGWQLIRLCRRTESELAG